jgi:hypothetical protein
MLVHRTFQLIATVSLSVFVLTLPASRLAAQESQAAGAEWQPPSLPETFSAFAIVMGHVATGRTDSIMIRITRWSTPEERESLLSTIIEHPDDKDALRNALQEQEETGFIRGSDVGSRWPSERLRYAWQWLDEGTGNRRIVLALGRPIGGIELWASARTLQYQVSVIVLDVDKNGEGSGILSVGTKVSYDKELQRFIMENYSTEPVRLTNVRKTS